jgi:hypothetical protein
VRTGVALDGVRLGWASFVPSYHFMARLYRELTARGFPILVDGVSIL